MVKQHEPFTRYELLVLGSKGMQKLLGEPVKQLSQEELKALKRKLKARFCSEDERVLKLLSKRFKKRHREMNAMYPIPVERQRFLLRNLIPQRFVTENLPTDVWDGCRRDSVRDAFFNRFEGVGTSVLKKLVHNDNIVPVGMVKAPVCDHAVQNVTYSSVVSLSSVSCDESILDKDTVPITGGMMLPSSGLKQQKVFGRFVDVVQCPRNVDIVYSIIRKRTGEVWGAGYEGPIYGELTQNSMQKMINLMVEQTMLSRSSRFLDVGSGLGKPNLHVAQHPGVEFSCGVECELNRWKLGMVCLNACLGYEDLETQSSAATNTLLQGNTMFLNTNIMNAKTFDPFTHVYMFSVGFPPNLWDCLAAMWNRSELSTCEYLICYSCPKDVIESYNFNVTYVTKMSTTMHGSRTKHTGYIYRRNNKRIESQSTLNTSTVCDPLFKPSFRLVRSGLEVVKKEARRQLEEAYPRIRSTRSGQLPMGFSKARKVPF